MRGKSYAKINLSLDVISKRDDGYHNIKTIMQKISLYDELEIVKGNSGFELKSDLDFDYRDNLIYKGYKSLCDYVKEDLPIIVGLKKNIPVAAGLAGGTSNGAWTVKAMNELYNLGLSDDELCKICLKLGADFPFMIKGGTMLAEGIGEEFTPLNPFEGANVLIVNPGYGVSTPYVYKNIDLNSEPIDFDIIIKNLDAKNVSKLNNILSNKMEKVVLDKHKDLTIIKDKLNSFGGISLMSGSGPTIFSLFDNIENLNRAYEYFKPIYKMTFKTKTVGGQDEVSFNNRWFNWSSCFS